jgi:rod shape determining protein RodA
MILTLENSQVLKIMPIIRKDGCVLFFHLSINIGMTIGLVPTIGIPLPFISFGGSSLWAFTLFLFTFLRVDQVRK